MAPEAVPPRVRSELALRVVSAAVMAPVALAAVWFGGLGFAIFTAVVAVLCFWEWTAIVGADAAPHRAAGLILIGLALLALPLAPVDWAFALIAGSTVLFLLAGALSAERRWLALGFVYVLLPSAALIALRNVEPGGFAAILYLLAVVWATDIAAYFGGRTIGGAKLWPRVSPKKTWSGALCGLAGGMTAGALVAYGAGVPPLPALLMAAPLSVASQAGDLFESGVKRRFGVKDSGRIIPGHGGVLDRVDGVLGAAALAGLLGLVGLGERLLAWPGPATFPGAAS